MPSVITKTSLSQGHCWPPVLPTQFSNNVFAENLEVVRKGDAYTPHPGPCGLIPPHGGITALYHSPDVFANSIPVTRDADFLSCGDAADNGRPTVFANGAPGSLDFPGEPDEKGWAAGAARFKFAGTVKGIFEGGYPGG